MKYTAIREPVVRCMESVSVLATISFFTVFHFCCVGSVQAQAVTGSGTPGQVPVLTGTSTVGNSVITQSGGNVGIGTASPSVGMDINKETRITSDQVNNWNEGLRINDASNGYAVLGLGGSATAGASQSFWSFAHSGDGSNSLEIYNNGNDILNMLPNGNVGIGMDSPQATLDFGSAGHPNYRYPLFWYDDNASGPYYSTKNGIYLDQFGLSNNSTFSFSTAASAPGTLYFASKNTTVNDATSLTPRMTILGQTGNVGIGTTSPQALLDVNGPVRISGSGASLTFPDSTVQSTAWNGTTLGGDYAESVDVLGDRTAYEPGDVMVIDPSEAGKFERSEKAYSKLVAGVFSTKPGLVGRRTTSPRPDKDAEVPMAMIGIVPTKISTENGPIEPGDLLVSSSTPGYAMKGTDPDRLTGAVIGKALAPLKSGMGIIEVLISLQ